MSPDRGRRSTLAESARQTLDDFARHLHLDLRLFELEGESPVGQLYPASPDELPQAVGAVFASTLRPRNSPPLRLEVRHAQEGADPHLSGPLVAATLQRTLDAAQELRFFSFELAERLEEINLLYSISETLGSTVELEEGARLMLREVCDVMAARRGSLWVCDPEQMTLDLVASVGEPGKTGPIRVDDPDAVTARVFREGKPLMAELAELQDAAAWGLMSGGDMLLSVPIRYNPPEEPPRTVGVVNLIGRRNLGRFSISDQKLLSAIASQVGAALENRRLIQQSVARERMAREMELAHNLQLKLLPPVDRMQGVQIAARIEPAEMVGGDFYQALQLPNGRIGIMIGDVSSHGFPAALIMALSMSAASIYASEFSSPAEVLRRVDDALCDELETTEMYLSLFYGVVDPAEGTLTWANAGHPHAFLIAPDKITRLEATDPPVGIAGPAAYGEHSMSWNPASDLIVLFTDGLSDALSSDGPAEGEARLLREIVAHRGHGPKAIVDTLFDQVRSTRSRIPSDDRTALVLTGD